MPPAATFGAWIKSRRKQLDLTQSELGRRAGCSEAAIRKIEANERKPSRQLAELLARALEIPAAEKEIFYRFSRGVLGEAPVEARAHPNNLPTLLTSTIDRARDLANVSALLNDRDVHLVTLVGPPGIGKTRLSIYCGNEMLGDFPDGIWFVDLADITNADFFIPALAHSLPTLDLPPSPELPQLLSGLKNKTLLLILDNFEQIVEGASLDVAHILKACPNVKALVTSRVPLHIYGEAEYPLPPLSVPVGNAGKSPDALMQFESVQLFVARTHQHQPKFNLSEENAEAVVAICTILEGIPLALELAAATLRQMSLDEMVSLLRGKSWASQIATPARDVPQRQRTLENVIHWSGTLLSEEQRDFFYKLGVFSGWFDAEAVTAVCQTTLAQSSELLAVLADHSLLKREVIFGKTYWRMLELIHEYAVSKLTLEQLSSLELLRARYFLDKMQELQQSTSHAVQEAYFQANMRNFHGALKWAIAERQTELGFQLTSQLNGVWSSLGHFKEGLDFLRQLLALPSAAEPRLRASRLQAASDLAWQQYDFETALAYAQESVELGRVHRLKREYPLYLNRLGRIYIEQGKLAEAWGVLNKALELADKEPSILNPGYPLAQLGEVALFQGHLDEANTFLEKALSSLEPDDDIFQAIAKTDLAEVALAQGNFDKAHFWLAGAFEPASKHVRRFMVLFSALAGYLVLSPAGDEAKAAQFYGAIGALGECSGVVLGAFYQKINRERMEVIRQRLLPREWQQAFEAGSQWDKEEALYQARKELNRTV